MITIDGGTGVILHNGVKFNKESDKMADQWRLTANTSITSSTAFYLTSDWERVDSDGFGQLGTGMTESSGVFTFPSTGIYHIQLTANFRKTDGGAGTFAYISTTTDGSSYDDAALSLSRVSASNSYSTATCDFVFDVTNTSTHKVMVKTYVSAGNTVAEGNSGRTMTGITFTRLGDT